MATQQLTTDNIQQGSQTPSLGRDSKNDDIAMFYDLADKKLKQTPNSTTYQIQNWEAKTYRKDPQFVVRNGGTYILIAPVPYVSSDFEAELAAGDWEATGGLTPEEREDFEELVGARDYTKEHTGFTNNQNIDVSYNSTARTVTLTGTFEAFYRDKKVTALVSGWVSDPHPDVAGDYFLLYNGTDFVWATSGIDLAELLMCYVQYGTVNMGIREPHGFMPNVTHEELHDVYGTYLKAGGDLSNYVLDSETIADRRPDVSATTVKDEDLPTIIPALTDGSYTHRYLSGSEVRTIVVGNDDIIPLAGSRPKWNENIAGTWSQTDFDDKDYGAVFVVGIPVTSDAESQQYRYLYVQPQIVSDKLKVIESVTSNDLVHGDSSALVSEFVFFAKIIVRYKGGDWKFISVEKLTGTRVSQVAAPGGDGLTAVSSDDTISGDGTPSNPQSVTGKLYNVAKTFSTTEDREGLTQNRVITHQNKDLTPAGLDDTKDYQMQIDTSSIIDSDPGVGRLRFNNATQGSATKLYINDNEYDNGFIIDPLSNLSSGAIISLKAVGDRTKWVNYEVSGITAATDYSKVTLIVKDKGVDFDNNDIVGVTIVSSNRTKLISATFVAGIADVDPGPGNFSYNNETQGSATRINISEETGLNAAVTIEMIKSLKAGATGVLECLSDSNKWATIKLSGDDINASTYSKLPLTVVNKGFDFAAGDQVAFVLLQTGNVATTITAAPTIAATVLNIDFENNNTFETTSEVPASANFSITLSNDSVARNAHIDLLITNAIVITLPANSLMQDDEDRWTPSPTYELSVDGGAGNSYELSFRKVGTKLKWILSNKFE